MKLRYMFVLLVGTVFLAGCTLASDITPPPDYIPPTPAPTLGPLYPPEAPDLQNGAALYADHCAACHGDKGMGDGPQGIQLQGVTVPALALPEIAQSASPAQWFMAVSQGNINRFMPPFVGALSNQERWDVVAYLTTLHTTPEGLARGKQLFEANCPDCASKFTDQKKMAALSEADLARLIKNGDQDIPAFGTNFTDEEAQAVAAYLRTLTFAAPIPPTATPQAALVPTEAQAAVGGAPQAGTAVASTPGAVTTSGTISITGKVEIASGALPADLTITLHGYDHAQDQTKGPQEVVTLTATAAPDGSFVFENVEFAENRIFLAEAAYQGVQYQSGFQVAKAGTTQLALTPIKLYETSEDYSLLKVQQVHIYSDFATEGKAQFLEIYAFTNTSDRAVVIATTGRDIPFIQLPEGAQDGGFEAGQDSEPFISSDKGVAVLPSDKSYSIIAFFTLPYADRKLEFKQAFALDAASVLLLFPDGLKVQGDRLTDRGLQSIQNNNYREYLASDLKAGDTLDFTVSGKPKGSSATGIDTRQGLLIGAGALGVVLILAGVWLYLRDRRRVAEDEAEAEFESAEEVMDAMLALDDLQRAGKISEKAYRERRDQLKQLLKDLS